MNLHPDTQNPFSQVLLHIFLIEDETQKKKFTKENHGWIFLNRAHKYSYKPFTDSLAISFKLLKVGFFKPEFPVFSTFVLCHYGYIECHGPRDLFVQNLWHNKKKSKTNERATESTALNLPASSKQPQKRAL